MLDFVKRLLLATLLTIFIALLMLGSTSLIANAENTLNWIWPTDGVITDTFGTRNGTHKGVDIGADFGTPIHAVDDGTVIKSFYSMSYGNVIFIKHKEYETVYAHLQKRLVKEGEKVTRGQIIGEMGSTGYSTGSHLHFEVHHGKWTFGKENALDPFQIFGLGEIGQHVKAGVENLNGYVEALAFNKVSNEQVHTVQKGETLWQIARLYHVSIQDLIEWNQLKDEKIHLGQRIVIKPNIQDVYVVKSGDTLFSIAKKYHMDVHELKAINQLQSNTIMPMQTLKVKRNS